MSDHYSETTGNRGTRDLLVTILPPSYSSVDVLSRVDGHERPRSDMVLRNPAALLGATRLTPATRLVPCGEDVIMPSYLREETNTCADSSTEPIPVNDNAVRTPQTWEYRTNSSEINASFAKHVTSHTFQCEFDYGTEECYIDCTTGLHVDFTDRADDINNSNMIDWRYFPNET